MAAFLSIGPLVIPIRLVVDAACVAAALLAAGLPLRGHRRLRSKVMDLVSSALVVFVLAWKLTPALLHPRRLVADPLPLLMAMPGLAGIGIGAAGAAAVVLIRLWRRPRLRRAVVLPLALLAGISAVGIGGSELAFSLPKPARVAPELYLPALDGRDLLLSALRGRVVVVNFWATWCPPCRAELPELVAFAGDPGTAGAVLLAVNLTATEGSVSAVEAFARERELPFPVLLDRAGTAAGTWGVRVVPTTFVVAPDGRIRAERAGGVDAAWLRREVRKAAKP